MSNKELQEQRLYRKNLRKEILRKLVHLLELPLLVIYTVVRFYFGEQVAMLFLTTALIILLEIEYFRLEYKLKLPEVIDILKHHEKDNLTGSIFFTMANIICFAAYDYKIALLALLMTVFGDLFSALVGRWVGRTRVYKKKTLEGFTAGLLVNILVGYLVLPAAIPVFLAMSFTASLVELFTGKLDDNLTVPLASGFVGQVLVYFMGISLTQFPGPGIAWIISLFHF